ncbi:4910_t:CDS:1, partial [Funneliformis caledonium]
MTENFANTQSTYENIQDINSFFNNIPDCEEDFIFLQDQNSFETALLFQESTSSSSKEWENDSAVPSIVTE